MRRLIFRILVGLVSALALLFPHGAAALDTASAQGLEYEVKAAYIFNLANFTVWPPAAFAAPDAPLKVCVADPNPFGDALDRAFHNEHVGSHPVQVTPVRSADAVRGCHILFIAAAADASGALLRAAGSAPVLTVGESAAFEKRGGIITFVMDAGRVRFDANVEAASRAGIQLSSKVLQVARKTA